MNEGPGKRSGLVTRAGITADIRLGARALSMRAVSARARIKLALLSATILTAVR